MIDKIQKLHNSSQLRVCTSQSACLSRVGIGVCAFSGERRSGRSWMPLRSAFLRRSLPLRSWSWISPVSSGEGWLRRSWRRPAEIPKIRKNAPAILQECRRVFAHIYVYLSFIALSISRFISFCFNASRLS